jgi:hypothetical protein
LWCAVIRDALPLGKTALEVIAPRADLLLPNTAWSALSPSDKRLGGRGHKLLNRVP